MYYADADQNEGKILNEVSKMILLNGRHRCSAVRQVKVESGYALTGRPLRGAQVVRQDGQGIGQAERIKP